MNVSSMYPNLLGLSQNKLNLVDNASKDNLQTEA